MDSPSGSVASSLVEEGDKTVTLDNQTGISQLADLALSNSSLPSSSRNSSDPSINEEEQALDSNEVLELQTFIDKKDWIVEKIKLLEKLPPVQVFVGLESVKASSEEVVGLPSRDILKQWLVEHDSIEKETEMFDTGELKKLRKFTRVATKRNLSPQDTDLIELTLTTIYELDKLLHLLRDRSDNLDLLGTRISWEENRIAAWKERRSIIADLHEFLESRGRWSSSVYETLSVSTASVEEPPVKTLQRRSSMTSLASISSLSIDTLSSTVFSRAGRYKLAEGLSREAAQISARVATLHHGKINMAGKVLDKLIDNSRQPVPEEVLDEQDKLEDKVSEMNDISKFVTNITLQWRKADEIYVETMKDQSAAQSLLDDIEDAKSHLPEGKNSTLFSTRAETLLKRLAFRGNPASPASTFPRPHHPLFPDQTESNALLAQALSDEIASARHLIAQAAREAKDYKASYQAVKQVQDLLDSASSVSSGLTSVVTRLENGVESSEEDGSPLDLMQDECLQPTRYAAFLALLPTILEEEEKHSVAGEQILRSSRPALVALRTVEVDLSFHDDAAMQFHHLSESLKNARQARENVAGQASRLRESRKIWHSMENCLEEVSGMRRSVGEAMEQARWRQQCTVDGAPPTPESPPPVILPEGSTSQDSQPQISSNLHNLNNKITVEVSAPFEPLSHSLESPLRARLSQGIETLKGAFKQVDQMATLLQSIQNQSSIMTTIRDEFQTLQVHAEQVGVRLDSVSSQISSGTFSQSDAILAEADLGKEISDIDKDVKAFVNGLSQRVPFLARRAKSTTGGQAFVLKRFSSVDLRLGAINTNTIELPFDLQHLDDAIRTDCNAYVMRINGSWQALLGKADQLHLVVLGAEFDTHLGVVDSQLVQASGEVAHLMTAFHNIVSQDGSLDHLKSLNSTLISKASTLREGIASCFIPLRADLGTMEQYCLTHSSCSQSPHLVCRSKQRSDREAKFIVLVDEIKSLSSTVQDAIQNEIIRLERKKAEEDRLREEEMARREAEEVERARLEKERLEKEAREKAEADRLAQEAKEKEERDRLAAEEAERIRLERERIAREERKRMEDDEKVQEDKRLQEEQRLNSANLERERLAQENKMIEEKLRCAEEQLAETQRQQEEKERMAAEETRRILLENQRLKKDEVRRLRETEVKRISSEKERAKGKHRRLESKEVATPVSARYPSAAEDVFGPVLSTGQPSLTQDMVDLQSTIASLRRRLRTLSINELSRRSNSPSSLPTLDQVSRIDKDFQRIKADANQLPHSTDSPVISAELRSLHMELRDSEKLLQHLQHLAQFASVVVCADAALSDLLEHIDSYPAAPTQNLTGPHRSNPQVSAEEQIKARLTFTSQTLADVSASFANVNSDERAIREKARVFQTWSELRDMAQDRVAGGSSRPVSAVSSGRESVTSSGHNSRASIRTRGAKTKAYSNLSTSQVRTSSNNLAPPTPSRRAFSGASPSRPSSQLSTISSSRSFSGPGTSTLMQGTVASRQRTNSVTSKNGPRLSEPRSRISNSRSTMSPTTTSSTHSHTSSLGTWSRAPRLSTLSPPTPKRKAYVANPKSKLDVAVGDVVNNLPMNINIQGVSWKDQSGRYWIGEEEPKLCFCRILRSQTVMVRVGGGWAELSKFIRDHFADSFRLVDSPKAPREEPWISSATLLEQSTILEAPPEPPKTPEPGTRRIPSFSVSSPSGASPHSLRSSPSSHGSPGSSGLTPFQFLRRTAPDDNGPLILPALLRPATPTRTPKHRAGLSPSPNRPSIWRP